MTRGWQNQPYRHSLASKGIETTQSKGNLDFYSKGKLKDLDTESREKYHRGVDGLEALMNSVIGEYGEDRVNQFGVSGGISTDYQSAKDFATNKASHRHYTGLPIVITYDGEKLAELNDILIHAEPTVEWLKDNPRIFHAFYPNAKMTDSTLECARNRLKKEKEVFTKGMMNVHPDAIKKIEIYPYWQSDYDTKEKVKKRVFESKDDDALNFASLYDMGAPQEIIDKIEIKEGRRD